MISYYEFTEAVRNHLIADNDINSVEIGDISKVDFNKQEIYPFAHILITGATFVNGVIQFGVTVSCMDVVDVSKGDIRDELEPFKGLDNKQDVLNTMLAVLENLDKALRFGSFEGLDYALTSDTTVEPFEDRFKNLVAGWSGTFNIEVPNVIQNCN